jgi:dTDP-4-dehydrorhamnose 3,5-epimerase
MRPLGAFGVLVGEAVRHADARGYFSETFSANWAHQQGLPAFIQDNESLSLKAGTVRGLHFQSPPHAQAKLVRCVHGAVLDVAVDIRRASPSYGQHVTTRLSAASGEIVFVPEGFAHGFCTLEPETVVQYKVTRPYAPGSDKGLAWDDKQLAIAWPVGPAQAILSDRDKVHPKLADLPAYFSV